MSTSPYSSGPSRKSRFRSQRAEELHLPNPARPLEENGPGQGAFEHEEDVHGTEASEFGFDAEDRPSTAARPRQPYVYVPTGPGPWRMPLLVTVLVACGAAAGYFIGLARQSPAGNQPAHVVANIRTVERPAALTDAERAQLDAAYRAGREGRYSDSQNAFEAFYRKHPGFSKIPLEIARMDIYEQDYIGAQTILGRLMQGDSDARADAFFLSGVLNLKSKNFADAESSFASATDADPTRSEYYYFWGDCLRQEGKPQEAKARFQSALDRNQYETAEDLLQLKVWLCDIMMDEDKTDGADAVIDASVAAPYPRAAALLAAGARSLKAERYAEAARYISRGRAAMDQVVFNVVMQDPSFLQESWRPELAPFYNPAPVAPSQAAPAPAAASPAAKKP